MDIDFLTSKGGCKMKKRHSIFLIFALSLFIVLGYGWRIAGSGEYPKPAPKPQPKPSLPTPDKQTDFGFSCTLSINEISPREIFTSSSKITASYNLLCKSPLNVSTIPIKVGLFLDNQLKEVSEISNFPNRETRRLFISTPSPNQAKEYLLTLKVVRADVSPERASGREIYATATQRIKIEAEPLCEVRGTVVNVPDYIKLQIWVYAEFRKIDVAPGTRRFDFNFPRKRCDVSTKLHYDYRREYGLESAPKLSPPYISTYIQAFTVDLPPATQDKVFTDVTRDFSHLTSGIFLKDKDMRTDRPSYTFGDVISLIFQTYVKGPTGTSNKEKGTYTVTVSSGGLSYESKRDEIEVSAGEEKTITVLIHHSFYSRGRNIIKLNIQTPDYNFDNSTSCNVE